jgi:hypothetical protein
MTYTDPILEQGPYRCYAMNALHKRVVAMNPTAGDLCIMIATVRREGQVFPGHRKVYENLLAAATLLGSSGTPTRAPMPVGHAATSLRG